MESTVSRARLLGLYVGTSLAFATVVVVLALWPTAWSDFYNARPQRGEMGLGRFLIRGARIVNGKSTPFAYAWRLVHPSSLGRTMAWGGYMLHQLGQWWILSRTQQLNESKWSNSYRWWNWQMIYLNGFMLVYKLLQTHLTYDGLAMDVSEASAQGSVIGILVIALILAVPSRGVIFGIGKTPRSELVKDVIQFTKKYHGYLVSFGTVYNFHYHPAEGTLGHFFGFTYQCLLLWQSTTFLHTSHRDKAWVLLLETWVFIHGTFTALCQPGTTWQIFSYGFFLVFLVNQIYGTPLARRGWSIAVFYAVFAYVAYMGFHRDKRYYRMFFVPVTEYLCAGFCMGIGAVTSALVRSSVVTPRWKPVVLGAAYIVVSVTLTIGLAIMLGGHLRVYDDY
ncbi:hypothetical protein DFQ28_011268 [Apophysomyces sp. BC1034]|nr:hypothetical protein DFQ30_010922 [Apophysomyces sp. BC1015]KAG0181250.1 hypothetical protein DFQ29_008953 [Apophysomyces sp. BC1021]KAG0191668.1 hypothetical protein DFQ28_011268 [Apophysomyces sp. BC1034]